MGKNIKFLRKLRGLSQRELAERIGLKRNNIASYEAGIVEPRAATFIRMARFFEVDPTQLLTQDITLKQRLANQGSGARPALSGRLTELERKTDKMEKVVLGFREFYGKERNHYRREEINDLLSILEDLVTDNQAFLKNYHGDRER